MNIIRVSKQSLIKMLSTVFFVFALNLLFSQSWETILEQDGIVVEKGNVICKSSQGFDYSYLVLRIKNTTNVDKEIDFEYQAWYGENCQGNCVPHVGDPVVNNYIVPANGELMGNCERRNELIYFEHSLVDHPNAYKSVMTSFEITNFKTVK